MTNEEARALLICSEAEGDTPCSECPLYERCKAETHETKPDKTIAEILNIFAEIYEALNAIASLFGDYSHALGDLEGTLTVNCTPSTRRPPAAFRRPIVNAIKSRAKPYYAGKLYKIISALFRPCGARRFRHAKITKRGLEKYELFQRRRGVALVGAVA